MMAVIVIQRCKEIGSTAIAVRKRPQCHPLLRHGRESYQEKSFIVEKRVLRLRKERFLARSLCKIHKR